MSKDYSNTVNLPKTDFPMKANLVDMEPKMLKYWDSINVYKLILQKNSGKPKFILHDGPPYANAPIHMGHVLNKVLKDIILKYKSINGFYTPFIPGWDCHGLPIEYQLFKELGIDKDKIGCFEFRKKAREYAEKFINIQMNEFKRLGVFADWENPYITMSPEYESHIVKNLKELFFKGYIYRRKKPVFWCISCKTALADAEVEYEDKISPSIYVMFKVAKPAKVIEEEYESGGLYVLVWTTTPWTIPANLAVAFNPDASYVVVSHNGRKLIIGELLYKSILSMCGGEYEVLKNVSGNKLARLNKSSIDYTICEHPLIDGKFSIAVVDESVAKDEGTGIVHIAPGHGEEDYFIGLKFDFDVFCPVDESGRFTYEIPFLENLDVYQANEKIIETLKSKKLLLYQDKKVHSYPHCWRCKNPIIFRATEQWFLNVDENNLREKMLKAIDDVIWIPPQGKSRIGAMVKTRPDWCLSRQRYWGVPIPVVYCKNCKEPVIDRGLMEKFETFTRFETSDIWFSYDIYKFLPEDFKCQKCGSKDFYKEKDIVDVWFDSGISHDAVLKQNPELVWPADLYLEGSDQHRGWFQTSLIPSVAIYSEAPYRAVLTHGFVVDGEGRKMSKSLGNVISPQDVLKTYGADILRLWVASSDYSEDVRLSDEILSRLVELYRKLRNTIRFLLGNLYDFSVEMDVVEYENMWEIDRWILHKLECLVKQVIESYENYEFYKVVHLLNEFCVITLSNFYFDVLKDRLYTFHKDSKARKSAQTALFKILDRILKILAPIMPFTVEEAYQHFSKIKFGKESIFLEEMPELDERFINQDLDTKWQKLLEIRDVVNRAIEIKRKNKEIGSSLDAKVKIIVNNEADFLFLKSYEQSLPMVFITSGVELEFKENEERISVLVDLAEGRKCLRCWNYSPTVVDDICDRCSKVLADIVE